MSFARVSYQQRIMKEMNMPSGVPINGLPGWENVPLHLKLPMLQTPSNQSRIIFTRAKVGKNLFRSQGDFDARILDEDKIMYNPLHDPHLRKFFSNPKMIQKLLRNDEITENLDVRCTLKEFNQFRTFIHRACLNVITQKMKETLEDQKNRAYLKHAFEVARSEELKPPERSPSGYLRRKNQIIRDKYERNLENWEKKLDKIYENEIFRKIRNAIRCHNRDLKEKRAAQIRSNAREMLRWKEITDKKNLEIKEKRSMKAKKTNLAMKQKKELEKSTKYYQQRLKNKYLTEEKKRIAEINFDETMRLKIEHHKKRYQRIWKEIERRIFQTARSANKFSRKTIPFAPRPSNMPSTHADQGTESRSEHIRLSNTNLKSTLNLIIDQERNKLKFTTRESFLYKERTANYVVEEILNKFKDDLRGNDVVMDVMCKKLHKFFIRMKQQQLRKAVHIISESEKDNKGRRGSISAESKTQVEKQVSFTKGSRIIGEGFYEIEPDVDIKHTKNRPPTPTESLTSIGKQPFVEKLTNGSAPCDDDDEEDHHSMEHEFIAALSVNAKIFVEHLFVKFKRRVVNGIGKMVLECLCHYGTTGVVMNKIGFLNVPMDYVEKTVANSILSYAVNSKDFEANIILSINVISSQIIDNLVQFLRPKKVAEWDCHSHDF